MSARPRFVWRTTPVALITGRREKTPARCARSMARAARASAPAGAPRPSSTRLRSAARRRAFRMRSANREGMRLVPDELPHGIEEVRLEPSGRRALEDGRGTELAAPAPPVHMRAHPRVDLDVRVGAVGLHEEREGHG